jgi:hypothetical protein
MARDVILRDQIDELIRRTTIVFAALTNTLSVWRMPPPTINPNGSLFDD